MTQIQSCFATLTINSLMMICAIDAQQQFRLAHSFHVKGVDHYRGQFEEARNEQETLALVHYPSDETNGDVQFFGCDHNSLSIGNVNTLYDAAALGARSEMRCLVFAAL
jgi:hypothetical protein